jgi:uncharacterized protein YidB (DUF937 family)
MIMGLLDSLLQSAAGAAGKAGQGEGGASPDALMGMVGSLLQQQGGLGGLLGTLEKAGLGDAAKSWVGTGENLPVSPDALVNALGGSGQLAQLAQGLGLDGAQASGLLAKALPMIIDQMTPGGQLPAAQGGQGDLLQAGLKALQGSLFRS